MMEIGDHVKVKPEYDIPELLRPNGPSRGVIDRIEGDVAIVIVEGKSVPYELTEIEKER
jgi:hypothetical protein